MAVIVHANLSKSVSFWTKFAVADAGALNRLQTMLQLAADSARASDLKSCLSSLKLMPFKI